MSNQNPTNTDETNLQRLQRALTAPLGGEIHDRWVIARVVEIDYSQDQLLLNNCSTNVPFTLPRVVFRLTPNVDEILTIDRKLLSIELQHFPLPGKSVNIALSS